MIANFFIAVKNYELNNIEGLWCFYYLRLPLLPPPPLRIPPPLLLRIPLPPPDEEREPL
jgi:hypothetical protein